MKQRIFSHRRLFFIIDAIGISENEGDKLLKIRRDCQSKHKKDYSFGSGRVITRAIHNGTRIYVFDLYFLKELSIVEKCKHYFFHIATATLRHVGIDPKPVKITIYP